MIDVETWRESRALHKQTTFAARTGPDAGDCMRAAVATHLRIDPSELTNWMTLETDGWSLVMERELERHGWFFYPGHFAPDAYAAHGVDLDTECVLTGDTAAGISHCVVGTLGGQLLWDPLGDDRGLERPSQVWLFTREPLPGLRRGFDVLLGAEDEWHH
jgi:hypothetical protein